MEPEKALFARKTSGLIRSISGRDALIYNVVFMAPMSVFIYGVWASVTFPGTDLPLTALMCIPLGIVIGLFYSIYSVSMPRSGGDYVWVSRVIHPAIGFAINFFMFINVLSLVGTEIPWIIDYAITPYLMMTGDASTIAFISTPGFKFALSLLYYLALALIIAFGAKVAMKACLVSFAFILMGLTVFAVACIVAGPTGFQSNFNEFSGMNYDSVVQTAISNGWPGLNMAATMLGIQFTMINFLGFTSSVYISGEVKDVRKTQLMAVVGSVIIFGLLTWIAYATAYYAMGGDLIGSISYLAVIGDPSYNLPMLPFFTYLFMYVTRNTTVAALMYIGWIFMPLSAGLTYMFIAVRLLFAWSFDRVLPTAIAKIDRRFNTPYIALIITVIVAIIYQILWIYTALMSFFSYLVFGWMIMQIVTGISAIIFPIRRKDIFEKSPDIVKRKIGPIPVLTILGILTIIISIWLGYASMGPAFIGVINFSTFGFTIGTFVVALIIYAISAAYNAHKGLPLGLTFKEVPPE
jgi:amino acid transporter